ncbi:enoyl-CoA hydratase/isomerase family protein [Halalkalibacter oceani]|uniref:enoyl-CoA hydratase/isomerase family protein n=1 Tax=Halalkalibacter oceani TaxID=1653776 RepID=UPI0033966CE0
MTRGTVYSERDGSIATIYLNRPKKRNALNLEMWKTITELIESFETDSEVKIVIFRGVDETAFAAGADIHEFKTFQNNPDAAINHNKIVLEAEKRIMTFSKPTIALIQGFCIGGGCEIACACDFRFSTETGKFAITPAKIGHIYNTTGTRNVINLIGPAKTKDLLYTGRILTAEEAFAIGLIDRIYQAEDIVDQTYQYAKDIAKNAQLSVRGAKHVIHKVLEGATKDTEELAALIYDSYCSKDFNEGVSAFIEKRKPHFTYS